MGKTTCAAAAALAAAEAGRRVLAVSTDPAHSLGDALATRLSGDPTPVKTRRGTLLAAELATEDALDRWTAERREALRTLAERGTYLDAEDVERFLGLPLPGADELIAWLEIARLARETGCDEVVVDTAPTAHTLRLLAMPEALRGLAAILDRLQARHRTMAEHFGGAWRPDESDAFIADLESQARETEARLRDPESTAFFWVLLPEALAIEETRDALAALDAAGLPVRALVVNRVLPPGEDEDPLCRERRQAEAEAIREIHETFADREIRFLPEMEREPRGKAALRRIGWALTSPQSLIRADFASRPKTPRTGRVEPPARRPDPPLPEAELQTKLPAPAWLDALVPPTLRLLLFGGKGGVGKTTCAAAVALTLAERRPESRILLLSTDPAHSLADALEVRLSDDERPVPGAPGLLQARELDAGRAFSAWRERHRDAVGEAAGAFTLGGAEIAELLDLTPPGLDELIAVSSLLDAVFGVEGGAPSYDLVVVDTAPTGHALRLLETPDLALAWDHALLSLLLKYREVVGLGDLAAELVALSRSLKRLQALLRDPDRTRFVPVTRAAELPRRETVRLLRRLRKLGIAVPAVVLNAVPPSLQKASLGRCAIMKAPAVFPPPRGVRRLAEWVRSWEEITG